MFKKISTFFNKTIWTYTPPRPTFIATLSLKYARIFLSSAFKFYKQDSFVKAASLTYYSINSLVPILALFVWLATYVALGGDFKKILIGAFPGVSEGIHTIFSFSEKMLELMSSGVFIVVGSGILLWSVFALMNNIEKAINAIWDITEERSLGKRFLYHFLTVCLFPFLMSLSISLNVAIKKGVISMVNEIGILTDWLTKGVHALFLLSSYLLSVVIFTLLYHGFPNRKIRWQSSFVAALIAGLLFFLFERLYINSQIGVSRMNAIYGGIAALPLFLLWLNISWMIILYGVHLSYHIENYPAFTPPSEEKFCIATFKKLCVTTHGYIENQYKTSTEKRPIKRKQIAQNILTSVYQLDTVLTYLCDAGLIKKKKYKSSSYEPITSSIKLSNQEIEYRVETLYEKNVVFVHNKDA